MSVRAPEAVEMRGAVATKREVEAKLRELIKRLEGADRNVKTSLAEALPEERIVEVRITDLDEVYWTKLAEGRMSKLHHGAPEDADIRVRVSSDDLVALMNGQKSLFSSFLG